MSSTGTSLPFAFVPSAGTWPGALGDFVASACNVYAGSWMESSGPSQLELEVLGYDPMIPAQPQSAKLQIPSVILELLFDAALNPCRQSHVIEKDAQDEGDEKEE